ncbi:putative CYC2-like protein [Leptomonas pyrrhocoris]|uniref:Putative CYC2-like protein n=1 Tax=Leptomonas pyrrhocoris TaxID=157538 RepID=A0A0N0DY34_LEPPY|nr:putative CYC2-like protein [Leptomonas pyrrhocoris]KPA83522.1 putative CYC2-like protein [Leptomonas pyrrhocoris]|eukprot:XP_015661961.1 putative CYC2-like protein [Leptomonas pyrrhocoris]
MSSRARASKTPAQARLAEVVASYVQHLIHLQANYAESVLDGNVFPPPNDKFASHDFFCATHTPPISVEKYTDRLVTYMQCSPEVFMFALAYLRRLVLNGFPLHSRSIHRLLLTSVLVALKCRDDVYYHMSFYAEVGGVTPKDLCIMEIRFLSDLIHFQGEVSVAEYQTVMNGITRATQRRLTKSSSNDSELSSQGGLSAGTSTTSTPGDVATLNDSDAAFAPSWTSECEIYPGI